MEKQYNNILNFDSTIAKELFEKCNYPWEVLPLIKHYILKLIPNLDSDYIEIGDNVYAHKSSLISKTACIVGPTIIGKNTEIRHSAYIRGSVIIGDNCVIGNSTEVKNTIIFNNVQCPHFNYVGDSVMGEYSHIGAGVILSNVKSDKTNIKVVSEEEIIETGLRKFGAIIGDNVEVGCNSVLCPGTVVYPNSIIYPLTRVRGVVGENTIMKDKDCKVKRRKL